MIVFLKQSCPLRLSHALNLRILIARLLLGFPFWAMLIAPAAGMVMSSDFRCFFERVLEGQLMSRVRVGQRKEGRFVFCICGMQEIVCFFLWRVT